MDDSMMSSTGGSGMDMGPSGMFRHHNQSLARIYWYLIAACTVSAILLKFSGIIETWRRSVYVILSKDFVRL